MKTICVRPMAESDLPGVLEIESENFSIPWSEQSFRNMLSDAQALFFVAEDPGETARLREAAKMPENARLLGYAGAIYAGTQADVTKIAVCGTQKQCGIGTELLRALLQALRTRDVQEVFLEVREGNVPARALYRRLGFEAIGTRKGYYTEPREDAILMKCKIPS